MRKALGQSCLVLVILAAAFAIAPHLYHNQSLLFTMMTFVVLAQGLNLLYGFTGYLPFGYVGFFGAGAYGTSFAVLHLHVGAALALVAGGGSALFIGVLLGPLLRLSGAYFSIASLAASQILYFVVSNPSLTTLTGGPYGVRLDRIYAPDASYGAMLALMLVCTALAAWFRFSRFGLALRAMTQDKISADMCGVNVVLNRLAVWLASATIAGLAGGIYAWNISVFYPDSVFALQISVFSIVFALFGGVATIVGPVLGAVVLYATYAGIGISAPQYFQILYGLLIVLLVLFLPNGILSLFNRGTVHAQ